ncbi:DUF3536 domain-containing protein [Acidipila sp. EB88]|uniref:DUF3536 domain-containing protein n=1 Tax=Acidipila sp. EB88 TaxID=2305226 RepID=UPI000F5E5BC3|nr:DUF3536 domain-containing protein [Acidipila sp. EB88]RRA48302.1 DUF3536 domain-containing protein [Acidipila sp. EB88]
MSGTATGSASKDGNRYLVVHGHFYQPPRENPWIESVETQDSAAPYHDWNDRITAECYARNGASRVVSTANRILRIVNNYAQISFNFGPTLLSWLAEHASLTYQSILDADALSAARFGGHGSAMAQVYNHIIMPLASRRDKELQVRWGVADFEHRFGRKPEGMWLAETAADTESLEVLAEHGIRFTIMAPNQCAAVRPIAAQSKTGEKAAEDDAAAAAEPKWQPTPNDSVDPRHPYLVRLPSGRSITVFFYDGPRSRAIAFERLLDSGEGFARRLASGFSAEQPAEPELVHVATDGESYGHHHRFGEMALSFALQYTEAEQLATVTNYGQFLELFPPTREAQIAEPTSWSCAHGVERWRSDCGCNGGKAGWNQRWRGPLRAALDVVRDAATPLLAKLGAQLFKDWNGACDRYIEVILDRAGERPCAAEFLERESSHPLNKAEEIKAMKALEMVRQMQLMYTSCGWFFDDISGIETVQIIAYAARAIELAENLFGSKGAAIEPAFLAWLAEAQSNVASEGTGADIYRRRVKTLDVGLEQVAVHYAISSVFRTYNEHAKVFAFDVASCSQGVQSSGRGRLISGEAEIRSRITHECERFFYAVLHFGDQNIAAGVKPSYPGMHEALERFSAATKAAMLGADLPGVIRLFDAEFGARTHTIHSLFMDEQRRVMKLILNNTVLEAENNLLHLYEDHASLLHFLNQADMPRPAALTLAANFAINVSVRRALESDPVDTAQVRAALGLAEQDHVELDRQQLSFTADQRMRQAMALLLEHPEDRVLLENALAMAEALAMLPFPADIWQAQNIWHVLARRQHDEIQVWPADAKLFRALGETLGIAVESFLAADQPA